MPSPTSQLSPPRLNPAMVRAGAGAGKTTGLVNKVEEVYRLFQRTGELPRLVLTTFTRKATQEIKERLILRACEKEDAGLLQFVADPSRLQISTIHGLFNVFLRQVGHLAGLDAGFQILNEGETAHLGRMTLREVVVADAGHLKWLETYGFDRVLAMCRRYDELYRHRGSLRAATREDLEAAAVREGARWRLALSELADEIAGLTDNAAWSEYALNLRQFAKSFLGDGAQTSELPPKPRRSKKQAEFETIHERVEERIEAFKKAYRAEGWDQKFWPAMLEEWAAFEKLGEDFVKRQTALKERQARYSMSDLELKTLEILREKPFLGQVFAENWDYWMIDEYQDTSPLQVECLDKLIGDRPKYCVGDPQQSIYLFRGADVSVFERTANEIAASGGERLELQKNYRSEPDLLMFMNDVMAGVGPRFARMEPRSAPEPKGPCATFLRAEDGERELQAVVQRVRELKQSGARLDQICVLGRTHRVLMQVSRAVKSAGFATHVHSSRGFSQRREVIDARALWTFFVNPHDNQNLLTLLRSPWFYVEDWILAEWMSGRPVSLWRELGPRDDLPASAKRLLAAQRRLNETGLVRAFEETLISAAYLDLSLANDPAGRKESNLWKLILKARALEREGSSTALDFLDAGAGADPLDASEGDATSAQEPNCVNLMTIHGAKGLEFDHVILPRMGDAPRRSNGHALESRGDIFFFPVRTNELGPVSVEFLPSPLDQAVVEGRRARESEEFDRWLYVALTRAKTSLTLSAAKEFAVESWAARSAFFGFEAGVHERADYKFEVIDIDTAANENARALPAPEADEAPIRAAWRQVVPPAEARQSVTELITSTADATEDPDRLLRRLRAQTLGTRIHRAFEALHYGHGTEAFERPIQFVLGLKSPPLRKLIEDGESEWGFQVQARGRIIEGTIDLWGYDEDGQIWVADYKSGSPFRSEDAFSQLAIYAWALRRFGHTAPIRMVVLYPLDESFKVRAFEPSLLARLEDEFGGPHAAR